VETAEHEDVLLVAGGHGGVGALGEHGSQGLPTVGAVVVFIYRVQVGFVGAAEGKGRRGGPWLWSYVGRWA
jgi:hypothetical protein